MKVFRAHNNIELCKELCKNMSLIYNLPRYHNLLTKKKVVGVLLHVNLMLINRCELYMYVFEVLQKCRQMRFFPNKLWHKVPKTVFHFTNL